MSTLASRQLAAEHRYHPVTPGYHAQRPEHLDRLAKIEGQVRGLSRMVEQDRYCIDVLTQISAATKALQQVGLLLLDEHIRHCVLDAAEQGGAVAEQRFAELQRAIRQSMRL
jgi:DNA-binding FrmR family transcriptional regulator